MTRKIRIRRIFGLSLLTLIAAGPVLEAQHSSGSHCFTDQDGYRRCAKTMKDPLNSGLEIELFAEDSFVGSL